MKKILSLLLVSLLTVISFSSIFANKTKTSSAPPPIPTVGKYGAAGCGAGAFIIQDAQLGDIPLIQVVGATINAFSGNQTFGITTGTLGCTANGIVKSEKEQEIFVHMNIDSLEQEMAAGKGEKLNALATLFGCHKDSHKKFAAMTQKKYGSLFTQDVKNSPSDLISAIKVEITRDSNLATSCKI